MGYPGSNRCSDPAPILFGVHQCNRHHIIHLLINLNRTNSIKSNRTINRTNNINSKSNSIIHLLINRDRPIHMDTIYHMPPMPHMPHHIRPAPRSPLPATITIKVSGIAHPSPNNSA